MLKGISLSAVRAFEAAARNSSFRAAALELSLSPSAVSHAVVKLEQALGTALFERTGRFVRLSPDGETLMRHVGSAFEELRIGIETVTNRGPQLLRLHSAPSFAAQCLAPRLAGFLSAHPDVGVRLAASTDYAPFATDEFDADIVYGPVRGEGLSIVPLGEETVTPLCAPAMAERLQEFIDAGEMRACDPLRAAGQFFELCLSGLYRRRLWNIAQPITDADMAANVRSAVDVFLRGYAV